MKLISLFIFIALTLLGSVSPVEARFVESLCARLILNIEHRQLTKGRDPALPIGWTVRATDSKAGPRGGRLLLVEKTGEGWFDAEPKSPPWLKPIGGLLQTFGYSDPDEFYNQNVFSVRNRLDPQGTPRVFMEAYGRVAGSFFGFEQVSENQIWMPDVEEYDRSRLEFNRLNQKDGIQLPIGAYEIKKRFLPDREYLIRWARSLELPVGIHTSFYHDFNIHHVLTQMIPEEYLTLSQRQTAVVLNFEEHIKRTYPGFYKTGKIRRFFDGMIHAQAKNIDIGTGNFSFNFESENGSRYGIPHSGIWRLVGPRAIGKDFFESFVGFRPYTPHENLLNTIQITNDAYYQIDIKSRERIREYANVFKSRLSSQENALDARDIDMWLLAWIARKQNYLRQWRPSHGH